ncbi:alpha/beta hydrolase [Nocardia nova]|uniref:alpha/beta hydrolase n=1 Tax=Nocardia nova TaxID=37330 RepID=UPI0033EE8566
MYTPISRQGLVEERVEYTCDGITTVGFLISPEDTTATLPAVALGHGYAGVAEGDLRDFAAVIARSGFRCLAFDYRNFGYSSGEPRQEVDPNGQVEDFRNAVSFLRSRDDVDRERIGVWGTSFGGGHVLVAAATDRRIKCVVSQVPTISSYLAALRRTRSDLVPDLLRGLEADRDARFAGAAPQKVAMISDDPTVSVAYPQKASYDYLTGQRPHTPSWRNEITVRSTELTRAYEPGVYVPRIGPTPLLMIIARDDVVTPVDLQQEAYLAAHHPKDLLMVAGDHYDVYGEHFDTTSTAAANWFTEHLGGKR